MKGIYVLDLENEHLCMVSAESVEDALLQTISILSELNIPLKYDGSYHFYPYSEQETPREAERRIYILLGKKHGIQSIYTYPEFLESIGKGTYGPNMELRRMLYVSSVESIPIVSEEKEVFQMSI